MADSYACHAYVISSQGDKKIPESDRFYLEVNYPVEYMNGTMSVAKGKKQLSKYGQSMFFDQNWTVRSYHCCMIVLHHVIMSRVACRHVM